MCGVAGFVGPGLTLWPMTAERTTFPPYEMTDAEQAASAGRYVANPKAEVGPGEIPDEDNDYGRTPAAPHGTVYVADGTEVPEPLDIEEPAVEACTKSPAELGSAPDAAFGNGEAEPEPPAEAEEEVEEAEAEEEAAADDDEVKEIDVEALTVPELHAELDALGVEYDRTDRKDDLKALLYEALEEG